ncbi:hypothetical protein L1887_47995 [Cichorium endivia]|nr:hypothetical protein L1887_47995 [Cichorium endivia]
MPRAFSCACRVLLRSECRIDRRSLRVEDAKKSSAKSAARSCVVIAFPRVEVGRGNLRHDLSWISRFHHHMHAGGLLKVALVLSFASRCTRHSARSYIASAFCRNMSEPVSASSSSQGAAAGGKKVKQGKRPSPEEIEAKRRERAAKKEKEAADKAAKEAELAAAIAANGKIPNGHLDEHGNEVDRMDVHGETLDKDGFSYVYEKGYRQKQHGLLVAWRRDLFGESAHRRMTIDLDAESVAAPSEPVRTACSRVTRNVGLFVALTLRDSANGDARDKPGIVVATTHLFWHPMHAYERARQSGILVRRLHEFRKELEQSGKTHPASSPCRCPGVVHKSIDERRERGGVSVGFAEGTTEVARNLPSAKAVAPSTDSAAVEEQDQQECRGRCGGARRGGGRERRGSGRGGREPDDRMLKNCRAATKEDALLSMDELLQLHDVARPSSGSASAQGDSGEVTSAHLGSAYGLHYGHISEPSEDGNFFGSPERGRERWDDPDWTPETPNCHTGDSTEPMWTIFRASSALRSTTSSCCPRAAAIPTDSIGSTLSPYASPKHSENVLHDAAMPLTRPDAPTNAQSDLTDTMPMQAAKDSASGGAPSQGDGESDQAPPAAPNTDVNAKQKEDPSIAPTNGAATQKKCRSGSSRRPSARYAPTSKEVRAPNSAKVTNTIPDPAVSLSTSRPIMLPPPRPSMAASSFINPTPTLTPGSTWGPSAASAAAARAEAAEPGRIGDLKRFTLWETKTRFYLVAYNTSQTRFRILKVDRTPPTAPVSTRSTSEAEKPRESGPTSGTPATPAVSAQIDPAPQNAPSSSNAKTAETRLETSKPTKANAAASDCSVRGQPYVSLNDPQICKLNRRMLDAMQTPRDGTNSTSANAALKSDAAFGKTSSAAALPKTGNAASHIPETKAGGGASTPGSRHIESSTDSKTTGPRFKSTASSSRLELNVTSDRVVYSRTQVAELLEMIREGNRATGGLQEVGRFFGIVGFIRFTSTYYMVLISRRSVVALIGGHYIYHCDETVILPVCHPAVLASLPGRTKLMEQEEARLLHLFKQVDLSKNFYFSYTYDLTKTLQRQSHLHARRPARAGKLCIALEAAHHRLGLQRKIYLESPPAPSGLWRLGASAARRRSKERVGRKRFEPRESKPRASTVTRRGGDLIRARGLREKASTQDASQIDSQIRMEKSRAVEHHWENGVDHGDEEDFEDLPLDPSPRYTSYVMMRGSIPVYWTQDSTNMSPRPPIEISLVDPYYSAAALAL